MLTPIILENDLIKLVPMTLEYLEGFCLAGNYAEVWRWMPMNRCQNLNVGRDWMNEAIDAMANGEQLAFVIIDKESQQLVGSTRLFRLNKKDLSLELGYTFITPKFQRTYVNSNAKFLLLEYVFEQLKLTRVEFCAHEDNGKSRTAIQALGAKFEGILRKNRRLPDGSYRNTALFSILNNEWSSVRANLLGRTVKVEVNCQ